MIIILPYIIGERKYKQFAYECPLKISKESKENAMRSCREKFGMKVKCLNDNTEFLSMTEAAKYYKISVSTIRKSAKENKKVLCKNDNKKYQFIFI